MPADRTAEILYIMTTLIRSHFHIMHLKITLQITVGWNQRCNKVY